MITQVNKETMLPRKKPQLIGAQNLKIDVFEELKRLDDRIDYERLQLLFGEDLVEQRQFQEEDEQLSRARKSRHVAEMFVNQPEQFATMDQQEFAINLKDMRKRMAGQQKFSTITGKSSKMELSTLAGYLSGGEARRKFLETHDKREWRQSQWSKFGLVVEMCNYLSSKNLSRRDVLRIIMVCRSNLVRQMYASSYYLYVIALTKIKQRHSEYV